RARSASPPPGPAPPPPAAPTPPGRRAETRSRSPLRAIEGALEGGQLLVGEDTAGHQRADEGQGLAAEQAPHDVLDRADLVRGAAHQRPVEVAPSHLLALQHTLLLEDAEDGGHRRVGQVAPGG